MPDPESRLLDQEILAFIQKYRERPAPQIAFELLGLKIFAHQYHRNKYYRAYCDSLNKAPGQLRSWKDIPPVPTSVFKELRWTTCPSGRQLKIFETSGTTREKKGRHYFDTLDLYKASLIPSFEQHLLPDKKKMDCFLLIESSRTAKHSSLSYMAEVVVRELCGGAGKYYVRNGVPDYKKMVRDLNRHRGPALIFCTAFSLKGFLDHLERHKITLRLRTGSRVMETGGFKGKTREISRAKLYAQCRSLLGVPKTHCVSEYGMTELSSQYYDSTLKDHVNGIQKKPIKEGPAWLKAWVMDPSTGQEAKPGKPGLLCHVDIANRASAIAVQTEDLGKQEAGGFTFLRRVRTAELRGCSLSYEKLLGKAS